MLLRKKKERLFCLSQKTLYNSGFNEIYLLAAAFSYSAV